MKILSLALIIFGVQLVYAQTPSYSKEEAQVIADVLAVVKQSSARRDLTDAQLANGMLKGMLQAVDSHSEYFTKEEYVKLQESISGKFFGVGVYVDIQDGVLHVSGLIKGMPAEKAGLHNGDYITHIDGASTFGLSLTESSNKLKGKKGTKVKVEVFRKEAKEPLTFIIERDEIDIKSTLIKKIDDFLYIGISYFTQDTYKEFINGVKKHKNYKGIILDLRSNPGGLLDDAIAISSLFVKNGDIILQYSSPDEKQKGVYNQKCIGGEKICRNILFETKGELVAVVNQHEPMFEGVPVVVLVNQYSASASEILTLALQENARAIVIGQKTFGKGSVQSVLALKKGERGAIKLTTALYYSPKGNLVQTNGAKPDILIPELEARSVEKKASFLPNKESEYKNHIKVLTSGQDVIENISNIEDFALQVGISSLKTSIVQNADNN